MTDFPLTPALSPGTGERELENPAAREPLPRAPESRSPLPRGAGNHIVSQSRRAAPRSDAATRHRPGVGFRSTQADLHLASGVPGREPARCIPPHPGPLPRIAGERGMEKSATAPALRDRRKDGPLSRRERDRVRGTKSPARTPALFTGAGRRGLRNPVACPLPRGPKNRSPLPCGERDRVRGAKSPARTPALLVPAHAP